MNPRYLFGVVSAVLACGVSAADYDVLQTNKAFIYNSSRPKLPRICLCCPAFRQGQLSGNSGAGSLTPHDS